jgi:hypothetical protein
MGIFAEDRGAAFFTGFLAAARLAGFFAAFRFAGFFDVLAAFLVVFVFFPPFFAFLAPFLAAIFSSLLMLGGSDTTYMVTYVTRQQQSEGPASMSIA